MLWGLSPSKTGVVRQRAEDNNNGVMREASFHFQPCAKLKFATHGLLPLSCCCLKKAIAPQQVK